MDRTLDWQPRHDERSRAYPIRTLIPGGVELRRKTWRRGPVLDQGSEGACVGHAWANSATSKPSGLRFRKLDLGAAWPKSAQEMAFSIYREAQRIDDIPGEAYTGTSVLAGAQVMQSLGLIREYRWAFGINEVIAAIISQCPVVIGVPWYESAYEAPGGELRIAGNLAGGHALLATGYAPRRLIHGQRQPSVRLLNSWGSGWGVKGEAWITMEDLAALLAQDGEACVPLR